jgi:hypothetical protein
VCTVDPQQEPISYIGSLSKESLFGPLTISDELPDEFAALPRLSPISFETWDAVIDDVRTTDIWTYQGILLFDTQENKQIKLISSAYKEMWDVRNNSSNLCTRYLEIRQNPSLVALFFRLYPRLAPLSDALEDKLQYLSTYLYQCYVDRYIRKQHVILPKQEYIVIKKAHAWYNEDRVNHRMYRGKILSLLNEESPSSLYSMLKRMG